MARKINSEQTVDNDSFKLKVGTTDKKNPKTIYIDCGFFIEPKEEKDEYTEDIKNIEDGAKRLAKKISNAMKPNTEGERIFKKDFIFVFEVAETRASYGKKSYASIQLHLKQEDDMLNFNEIMYYTKWLAEFFTKTLKRYIEDIGFEVTKTKK